MFEPMCLAVRRGGMIAAVTGLMFYTAVAQAKPAESGEAAIGRINFDEANLPPANVELDLSQGMFENLFGIGDAAVAGIAETLLKSTKGEHKEATQTAAEELAVVRQMIGLAGKVVKEVRVRAYEKMPDDLSPRFDQQIRNGEWEKAVVVRKGEENARVYVMRHNGSIRGAFVIAGGHGGQVLVNVVCDISPDNVKSLTAAATKIGLENGLLRELELKFRHAHNPLPPAPPRAPAPPSMPQPPKRDIK